MTPEERHPFPTDHLVPSNPASIQHSTPKFWSTVWANLLYQILPFLGISQVFSEWHRRSGCWHYRGPQLQREVQGGPGWGREEGGRRGQQWTAMVCKTLIWLSGHLVWLTLTYILTLFWDTSLTEMFSVLFFLKLTDKHMFLFSLLNFWGFVRDLTN